MLQAKHIFNSLILSIFFFNLSMQSVIAVQHNTIDEQIIYSMDKNSPPDISPDANATNTSSNRKALAGLALGVALSIVVPAGLFLALYKNDKKNSIVSDEELRKKLQKNRYEEPKKSSVVFLSPEKKELRDKLYTLLSKISDHQDWCRQILFELGQQEDLQKNETARNIVVPLITMITEGQEVGPDVASNIHKIILTPTFDLTVNALLNAAAEAQKKIVAQNNNELDKEHVLYNETRALARTEKAVESADAAYNSLRKECDDLKALVDELSKKLGKEVADAIDATTRLKATSQDHDAATRAIDAAAEKSDTPDEIRNAAEEYKQKIMELRSKRFDRNEAKKELKAVLQQKSVADHKLEQKKKLFFPQENESPDS